MKKLFLIPIVIVMVAANLYPQRYMYVDGQKVSLKENKSKILVEYANETIKKRIKSNSANAIEEGPYLIINDSNLKNYKRSSTIKSSSYLFEFEDGTIQALNNELIFKLKKESDYIKAGELIRSKGLEIQSQNSFVKNQYMVFIPEINSRDALDLSNELYNTGYFEFVEPNFIRIITPSTADPFYSTQWALKNTGQYNGTIGSDIKAEYAWSVTKGSSAIKVAVLDEGVDLTHPDLVHSILPGFDATGLNSGGAPSGNDSHGTACAGIITAKHDNAIGGAGIAPNCKIIPVRIAYRGATKWVTTNDQIANGLNWAWQNGADVLSNSWGGGSVSSAINTALTSSTTSGRQGKGSVVVFGTGNNNTASVFYPSNLPNVIAVGALSMCNQRKSPSSCDGETFWGSNYGSALDITAPGVKIYTTDIQGAAGKNTSDYIPEFHGTSSACPHVSAVAALMLSVNPNLTQAEVFARLKCTANKIGSYTYDANGFNAEMGYGRVNAFNALMSSCIPSINLTAQMPINQSISYQAQTSISLKTGFKAPSTSTASFKIGCNTCPVYSPAYRIEDEISVSDGKFSEENTLEMGKENVNIYPNPGNGMFNLKLVLSQDQHVKLEVFSAHGQVTDATRAFEALRGENTLKLDLSVLTQGLYYFRVTTLNNSLSGSFVKQ